jgi:hypothetical protein
MSFRLLVPSLCLALLPGCAPVLGSIGTDAAVASQHSEAEADDQEAHPGPPSLFRFSAGLGAGKADLTCDGCTFDSRTGFSAFLTVDRRVASKTLIGLEANGWTREKSGVDVRIWGVMAHLTQYLTRSAGPFLSAGLGWTGFHIDETIEDVSGDGLGFSGRLGYEIEAGRIAIVPYVGYLRGLGGGGVNVGDSHQSTDVLIHNFQLGLGISFP